MRIQYRIESQEPLYGVRWGEWREAPPDRLRIPYPAVGVEMRIVDDRGNVVEQSPPFTPAFYERAEPGALPTMSWFTYPPTYPDRWIRRDDVKPTERL